ncbi:ArsR/SmtB family transcription factor [Lutibaculum baratangense]|uniref:Transcriptional regulator, ArsR family n=1 Tax=Lutibaculum baratangense AMV1 TaxID=631454 RepID=V4TNT5_9HYPH|nr:metalloregulator ArsR/SmtB family transcription factor [Lutibaculum baratangense]ESR27353.1 Transcriptional regulator, ArsR family [Lutibaculum baratangense AMV1]
MAGVSSDQLLAALRASGEPTRLRILALLAEGERSVKDLTDILGQSQPRISRHLKLLVDSGLVKRHPEGAWAFFRLAEDGGSVAFVRQLLAALSPEDALVARDRERLDAVRQGHSEAAQAYFARHAGVWDQIRSLHVDENEVEAAILDLLGDERYDTVVDLGTGTGRMLQLLADRAERGIGLDVSHDMLSFARSRLDDGRLRHCQVRQGDIYATPLDSDVADLVIVHQVLHFLDDPERAIAEARRLLKPAGRLLVVDFAPHDLEFLRDQHAHRRLGFDHDHMSAWLTGVGLEPDRHIELAGTGDRNSLTVVAWSARDTRSAVRTPDRLSEEAA